MRKQFFQILFICLLSTCTYFTVKAEVIVRVTVTGGNSTSICDDIFSGPDFQWGVNIQGQGLQVYPADGACFQNPPFVQYEEAFDCIDLAPETLNVCFEAFELDLFFSCTNFFKECSEIVCQDFNVPGLGQAVAHTLSIPSVESSSGSVNFTIEVIDNGNTANVPNDDICGAIDLGVLSPGVTLGDATLSSYNNFCATNTGEPTAIGNWLNEQGVWFSFTTGPNSGDFIPIAATADPEGLGDDIQLQIGLFTTDDGTCSGNLEYVADGWNQFSFNQIMFGRCLEPNTTYYILVDGSPLNIASAQAGVFGLEIQDPGAIEAGNTRCESEDLGVVPDGGMVSAINQTNECANQLGDPPGIPGNFGIGKGVWFQFMPPSTGHVIIEVVSSQEPLYTINAEIVLFSSSNNQCNGFRVLEGVNHDGSNNDESLEVECLDPDIPYWILIDGTAANDAGIFDITITDGGVPPPQSQLDTTVCYNESIIVGGVEIDSTGTYVMPIPLLNGCDSTVFVDLVVLDELVATAVEVQPSSSIVFPNGIAALDIVGGEPPYTVLWTGGQTTDTITNLTEGTYCALITDAQNCQDTACVTIQLMLEPVIASIQADTVSCFGDEDGVLTLTATGGDAPYSIDWSGNIPGNNGTSTLPIEGETTTINNLASDIYSVTITDLNGTTTVLESFVDEPSLLEVEVLTQQDPSCDDACDGSIEIAVTGGTPPYNINWTNGNTSLLQNNLCEGVYTVTITDANACTASTFTELTDPPPFIVTGVPVSPVTCFGDDNGSATVTTSGNPVAYEWDNGEITETATMLTGGVHLVTVTNEDGCTGIGNVTVEAPAAPLSITFNEIQPIICEGDNNGVIEAIVTGGSGAGYIYQWSNSGAGSTISNLRSGNYEVTITDSYGCTIVENYVLSDPLPLQANIIETPATCFGNEEDGILVVENVSGGRPPYQYAAFETGPFTSDSIFNNLMPGGYQLFVRDDLGCVQGFEAIVQGPTPLLIDAGEDVSIRLGESTQLNAQTSGDLDDIIFTWTPSDSLSCIDCPDPVANPFNTTTYTLIAVNPTSGCEAIDQVRVEVDQLRELYFPNVFSPNGDGRNDRLVIFSGPEVKVIRYMRIFSRWGSLVYELDNFVPNDEGIGWDGTFQGDEMDPGVYVFVAEVEFVDGLVQKYGGDITLVR